MGIVRTGTGHYERELAQWEQLEKDVIAVDDLGNSLAPGNRYVYRPFPKMLYKAQKRQNGILACLDNPLAYRTEQEQIDAESFNRRCQLVVQDDAAYQRARRDGWAETPSEALEAHEQRLVAIGDETAQRHYRDATMSDKAQAEALAADRAVAQHVPDVPVPPKRRGRPRKVETAV